MQTYKDFYDNRILFIDDGFIGGGGGGPPIPPFTDNVFIGGGGPPEPPLFNITLNSSKLLIAVGVVVGGASIYILSNYLYSTYEELKNNHELVNGYFKNSATPHIVNPVISDNLAKFIVSKLKNTNHITSIKFSTKQISENGIVLITEALKTQNQLNMIDFSCNKLGNQNKSVLAEILKITHITYLDLNNNNIGNDRAILIAEFLKNNKALNYLDISLNNINSYGIKPIIEALEENITISSLNLEQNNMDDKNKTLSNAMVNKYLERNKNLVTEYSSFQRLVDAINNKIANHTTNADNKSLITKTVESISQKIKLLVDNYHI